jgi:hypothetical protein
MKFIKISQNDFEIKSFFSIFQHFEKSIFSSKKLIPVKKKVLLWIQNQTFKTEFLRQSNDQMVPNYQNVYLKPQDQKL